MDYCTRDTEELRTSMARTWIHAGGEYQIPFMAAASRALREPLPACPRCGAALRAYFHVINRNQSTGTIWVWCGSCGTHVHLPRVRPVRIFVDPFAALPDAEFIVLETSRDEAFLDRLERLWNEGTLRPSTT
jgi:hypothetical protein